MNKVVTNALEGVDTKNKQLFLNNSSKAEANKVLNSSVGRGANTVQKEN